MPYTIYQAGPLFSQSEKDYHRKISAALKAAGNIVVWPGDLIPDDRVSDTASRVFTTCKQTIDRCTCVVALLDGSQIDDGTAWEMGYAHARGLPIYGISTDARMADAAGRRRMNAMIAGCLAGLAGNIEELVQLIHELPQADKVVDEAIKRGW
jgi:nucleoside 2-deoxyribosyltransferase